MALNVYPADPTITLAIIGDGKRDEIVVNRAQGEGLDGFPVDFDIRNRTDGRHFKLSAYPVVANSIEVILKKRNRTGLADESVDKLDVSFYFKDEQYGYIVLKHPLQTGEQLRVKYIASFDLNNPRLFTSDQLSQVYNYYGPQSLINSISVGTTIAFQNGAGYVVTVLGSPLSVDPTWDLAYKALAIESAYYIIPLPPQDLDSNGLPLPEPYVSKYSNIVTRGLQFVEEMSKTANRNESALLVGETASLTQDKAKELFGSSERVLFSSPNTIQYFIDGQLQTLDGRYLAAGLGGLLATLPLTGEALLNKSMTLLVPRSFSKSQVQLREIIANGISYFQPTNIGSRLVRAIMTSQSRNAVLEEPSVLRVRDYLAKTVRDRLGKLFAGRTIQQKFILQNEMLLELGRFLNEQKDGKKIITKFANTRIQQDAIEPRQFNVSFDFQPTFPLIWINVSFNIYMF